MRDEPQIREELAKVEEALDDLRERLQESWQESVYLQMKELEQTLYTLKWVLTE